MLGDDGCDEIHHGADCRRLPQVAVNDQPDVAREGWDVLVDPDEIVVSVAEKAGQAGHTHAGQLALPFFEARFNLARLVHEYSLGIYRSGASILYVNPGLGTTGPPPRQVAGNHPDVLFRQSEFWAQGLTFGLEYRY